MAYKHYNLVLLNIDGFYMYANDIRIDKRSLPEFMNTLIGDSVDTPIAIICFNETKEGSTFPFPPQYALHHSPRNLRDFDPQQGGGAAILVHDSLDVFHPVRLTAGVPPETVAVKFDGALFNCERSVVLICAYLIPATTPACAALRASLGQTQLAALHAHVITLRRDYEVVLVGDLNGWTGCGAGWEGEDAA